MGTLSNLQRSVAQRLARLISPHLSPEQVAAQTMRGELGMGEVGVPDADLTSVLVNQWRLSRDREERHQIRVRMDRDELISKALDVIADVATAPDDEGDARATFDLECGDEQALEEAERMVELIDLRKHSWGIVRRMSKYGNEMREPVLDASGSRVVRLKLLPEQQMWKRMTPGGLPAEPPWEQRPYHKADGSGLAFAAWQVIHYSHPDDEENVYGTGLLDFERTFMRLQSMEDDMVLARKTRAYDKLKHRVPVAANASRDDQNLAVKNYIDRLNRRRVLSALDGSSSRDNSPSVIQDYYVAYPGAEYPNAGPELMSPTNLQLQNIRDIEYFRALKLARLSVPMRYLNLGGAEAVRAAIGNGNISYEDIQFARTVRQIQREAADGHKRLIDLHLILRGFNPVENPVGISFPVISTSDAQQKATIDKTRAETLAIISGFLQVPAEMVVDYYMGLTAAEKERWFGDMAEVIAQMAAQAQAQAKVQAAEDAKARLAQANAAQQNAAPATESDRTKRLEEIASSVLLMAQREVEELGDDEGHELAAGAGTGRHPHGDQYPGPAA